MVDCNTRGSLIVPNCIPILSREYLKARKEAVEEGIKMHSALNDAINTRKFVLDKFSAK